MGALPLRSRLAVAVSRAVGGASRRLGAGSGTVVGGRAGLAIDPQLLTRLAAGRTVALVSGTNGKTTTTGLLAAALGEVAVNAGGSNMPAGHVAALVGAARGLPAVLEVDEGYLPRLVQWLTPSVVVLLNLSRDQLDRTNEVRMVAGRWRDTLGDAPATTPVANADDPLVVWAAAASAHPVWVAAGLAWRADAVGCPACEGRITFTGSDWACRCGLARPRPDAWLEPGAPGEPDDMVFADGRRFPLALAIPGRFNRANAAMAACAAEVLGVRPERALARMADVDEVGGRFSVHQVGGHRVRLMLAKNPAGWRELLELVCPGTGPLVIGINARVADGRDPSWLWDVPFERLAGRPVVATGERCLDLAVRLRYAGVTHASVRDPLAAVGAAAELGCGPASPGEPSEPSLDFIGNYTAFFDLLARR